ncbi:MAG: tyrosine-type recombinase/integrase [Bacillaceae bacterium]
MNQSQSLMLKSVSGEFNRGLSTLAGSISSLVAYMMKEDYYHSMMDLTDQFGEIDYSAFNDFEMMYLFVHKQRDLNKDKNRSENSKKEYLRDLVITYKLFNIHSDNFEIQRPDELDYRIFTSLTARNLRKYQTWIQTAPLGKSGKPYSPATLQRKMGVLKSFLTFLYKKRYIKDNIAESMLSSSVRFEERPNRDLRSKEVALLLDYFQGNVIIYSLLAVLATTGLRVAELCTARVCDLYYDGEDYWLKVKGKGRKQREVLIHQNVLKTIKRFRVRRRKPLFIDKSDYSPLFTTAKGKAYSYKYLSQYLTRQINKADLDFIKMRETPITPHFFRHYYAIESSNQGVSVQNISQSLGHSDLKPTMIYLEKEMSKQNNAAHSWKNLDIINNL